MECRLTAPSASKSNTICCGRPRPGAKGRSLRLLLLLHSLLAASLLAILLVE
jgi:hypothetical protein